MRKRGTPDAIQEREAAKIFARQTPEDRGEMGERSEKERQASRAAVEGEEEEVMRWPWISRAALDQATGFRNWLQAELHRTREDLAGARIEIKRLTDIIIDLKRQDFTLAPGHGDQPWDEGKYVMAEEENDEVTLPERVSFAETEVLDDELEASIRADLRKAFPDED